MNPEQRRKAEEKMERIERDKMMKKMGKMEIRKK